MVFIWFGCIFPYCRNVYKRARWVIWSKCQYLTGIPRWSNSAKNLSVRGFKGHLNCKWHAHGHSLERQSIMWGWYAKSYWLKHAVFLYFKDNAFGVVQQRRNKRFNHHRSWITCTTAWVGLVCFQEQLLMKKQLKKNWAAYGLLMQPHSDFKSSTQSSVL